MSHRQLSIIPILILILLSFSLAACNQAEPTPESEEETIECGAQELIDAIKDANADPFTPAEIHLPANCHITLNQAENQHSWMGKTIYNGLPRIKSEITIRGNHSEIEIQYGQGTPFGHFFINPEKTLELYNLTLSSGVRPCGGSIINNQGDLFLYDVQLLDNYAYAQGAYKPGLGGAIYNYLGRVRITANSLLEGNRAGETALPANKGGAVYSLDGILTIYNSNFLNNFSARDGGAIYAEKTIYNTDGGLIVVNNSAFSENQANEDGGAIYLKGEVEGVFLAASEFTLNEASFLGGGLYSEDSDVNTSHTHFYNNQAEYGGAVYTRRSAAGEISRLALDTSFFTYNTADFNGGAIFSENSDLELDGSIILQNQALKCGGLQLGGYPGLHVQSGDLETATRIPSSSEIINSSVSLNEAQGGYGGGACHLMGELSILNSGFNQNLSSFYGGGLISMDQLDVTNSTFQGNEARLGGGLAIGFPWDGINFVSPTYLDATFRITGSTISDNEAVSQGGGIWTHHGGSLFISKSTIGDNQSGDAGGGIYQAEGNLYIDNSTIAENTAHRGGGIFNHDGISTDPVLSLIHTTAAFNTATHTGTGPRSGGGGLNIKGIVYAREALVIHNTNGDCSLEGGMHGDYDLLDCGKEFCISHLDSIDSDYTCEFVTELNPQVGNFNGSYVPILPGSPLIDKTLTGLSHCELPDDQLSNSRPNGTDCEPGSIEYQSNTLPPPPSIPPTQQQPDETADSCDPFAGLEIATMLLSVNPDTLALPVYLRFQVPVPGVEEGVMPYRAELGGTASNLCNQQGFPDRLYCMFTLPPTAPGSILSLEIFKDGCEDPVYTEPRLTIPEIAQTGDGDQPSPTCRKDLNQSDCTSAGGLWPDIDKPYCVCP